MKRFLILILLVCIFALGAMLATSRTDFIQNLYARKKDAAVSVSSASSVSSVSADRCQDSDGGRAAGKKGSTCVGGACLFDRCQGERTLIENFCENGRSAWEEVDCAEPCVDGACVPATR